MKLAAISLSLLLVSAPLCAYERDGLTVTMTQEESEACEKGEGCFLVPKAVLQEVISGYQKRAYDAGYHACRNAT